MSGIRLPSAARATVKRVRTTTENPQSRLNRVLRHINPIQKEVVQRKLFVEQHIKGLETKDILKGVDIDPVLRKELDHIYQQPVKKMDFKGHAKSTDFVPQDLDSAIKKLKSRDIRRSHEYFFNMSSVMIIFQDMSHTKTNKMYHNNVVKKIKALSNATDSVTTKNMDPETLRQMLEKNDNLVRELKKVEYNPLESSPQLKSLCIPSHAIDFTEQIFDIVWGQSPQFQVVSVLLNLKTSSRLKLEFRKAFDTTTEEMPKDINYDSLLKMAQKSHQKHSVATSILTRIGQASFLDVSVTDDCISVTRKQ